ncbi:MAG: response regulator [Myxococcales bacterium]|nr:response regulator [Myxococcales bacterium]
MSEKRILVVDDDPDLRDTLCELLEDEGYQALPASNGKEALALLRSCPVPRVILLDLMMPVMNGWQFLEELARDSALASVPVIVMTAHSNPGRLALRPVELMQKPLKLDALLGAIFRCAG